MLNNRIFSYTFVFCVVFPHVFQSRAQTVVKKVTSELDSLVKTQFDDWRYSTDMSQLAFRTDYNDASWGTLKINQWVYPDSAWLRRTIIVPDTILGMPVAGGTIKLLVSVDDAGLIWINGESKGKFDWNGEYVLTASARGREKYLVAIKAINTGGPLRLLRAELELDKVLPLAREIRDHVTSLRVAEKLLSGDTYQTNARLKEDPGIDKSTIPREEKEKLRRILDRAAGRIRIFDLKAGKLEAFRASLAECKSALAPVDSFAKKFTLIFDSNAHIDAAWLWRWQETVEVCKNTFTSVLDMMAARPDFTYTQSSAQYYDWMEKLYPDLFRRISQRVNDGRWEIVGGMWVEPDCNLPSGESWFHHLLFSKRYFQQKFGVDVKIGWNPDSFGYNWNMAQFYQQAGIDAFITQKIGWNEVNVFPHRVFWWEAPNGSRILTYFPYDYVSTVDNPFQFADQLRQFEANTGFRNMLVLFGVGDHGGGPNNEMLERIERLKTLPVYPTIKYGTASGYLEWLKKQDLRDIPVWKDELYLEYHQGTFTTQAKMKEYNRRLESLLSTSEKFSSIATLFGKSYPQSQLEKAWREVMFNQFHDILPGSGIRENYIDATKRYMEAEEEAHHELRSSLMAIARQIDTRNVRTGQPVVVFNPLSWERTDVVALRLPEAEKDSYAVFDMGGKELLSQIVSTGQYARDILFIADKVPALGYRVYELRKAKPALSTPDPVNTTQQIQNQFYKVTVHQDSGWVMSVFSKPDNRELLAGRGNELQFLEDKPREWDAWNIGLTGTRWYPKVLGTEILENGPVRAILRVKLSYLNPNVKKEYPTVDFPSTFLTQDIILYNGISRVDFRTTVDWWEDKTMLKVAFPLAVSDTVATYEIPYGHITRPVEHERKWERGRIEVPSGRWADLSQSDYGISLLNKSKYGYDVTGNVIRLSLLRSPKWPDPTADRGEHVIEYSLYGHKGPWMEGGTVHRGYENNTPLIPLLVPRGRGSLQPITSFLQCEPENVLVTVIKKAEDSNAWVLQFYESLGKETNATITLPRSPKKVVRSNFLEEDVSPIDFAAKKISVPVRSNEVVTIKAYF